MKKILAIVLTAMLAGTMFLSAFAESARIEVTEGDSLGNSGFVSGGTFISGGGGTSGGGTGGSTGSDTDISGKCGSLTWKLTANGELTISGRGNMPAWNDSTFWGKYKYRIKSVKIDSGVKSISSTAFKDCLYLRSVQLPQGLTVIEDEAFENCELSEGINFPKSITAIGKDSFYRCDYIKIDIEDINKWCEISFGNEYATPFSSNVSGFKINGKTKKDYLYIDEGTTQINGYAFYGFNRLETLYLPESIKTIGDRSFEKCNNLDEIYYSGTQTGWDNINIDKGNECITKSEIHFNKKMDREEFERRGNIGLVKWHISNDGTLTLSGKGDLSYTHYDHPWRKYDDLIKKVVMKPGIVNISDFGFMSLPNLESIMIPDTVKEIGDYAFYDCPNLKEIRIPNSVTEVGKNVFENCTGLKRAILSKNIEKMGYMMFYNCKSLTDVVLPYGIKVMEQGMFYNCESLKSIKIPNSVKNLRVTTHFNGCKSLKNITLPDEIGSISSGAFSGTEYRYIDTWDNGALYIGTNLVSAFSPDNKELKIKDTTKYIAEKAFNSYNTLEKLEIPDSIKRIDYDAFEDCTALKEVNVNSIDSWCNIDFKSIKSNPLALSKKLTLNGKEITSLELPDTTQKIKCYTFYGFDSLSSITIPENITEIDQYAFNGCTGLKDIYYQGDADDWNKIKIGIENEPLKAATVHYNSPKAALSGKMNDEKTAVEYNLENTVQPSKIIIAAYKDGRLVKMITTDEKSGTKEIGCEFDTVKVMAWNSFNAAKPLAESIEISKQ